MDHSLYIYIYICNCLLIDFLQHKYVMTFLWGSMIFFSQKLPLLSTSKDKTTKNPSNERKKLNMFPFLIRCCYFLVLFFIEWRYHNLYISSRILCNCNVNFSFSFNKVLCIFNSLISYINWLHFSCERSLNHITSFFF